MTIKLKQKKKELVLSNIILLIIFAVFAANYGVTVNVLRTVRASNINKLSSAIKGFIAFSKKTILIFLI